MSTSDAEKSSEKKVAAGGDGQRGEGASERGMAAGGDLGFSSIRGQIEQDCSNPVIVDSEVQNYPELSSRLVPDQPYRVAVMGANSFFGQDFVDLLLDDPCCQVMGISRAVERSKAWLKYRSRPHQDLDRYRYHELDFNKHMEVVLAVLDDFAPQYIVNFAALSEANSSWVYPEQWFQTNVVAIAKLANHLHQQSYLQRFLQISSPTVYGHMEGRIREGSVLQPETPCAVSMASADMLLANFREQWGLPVVTVRSCNIYGAAQQVHKLIPKAVISIQRGEPFPVINGGRSVVAYLNVRDASRGVCDALYKGAVGECYHLSSDQESSVSSILSRICERLGVSYTAATALVEGHLKQGLSIQLDSTKACQSFGWKPEIRFEQGLSEVLLWIDQNWGMLENVSLSYKHRP